MSQRVRVSVRSALAALAGLVAFAALPSPGLAQAAKAAKAAPKARLDEASVKASFDAFASEWMGKMQRAEDDNRRSPKLDGAGASYVAYTDDFRVEIKPTGYARAPYVGVLRYEEQKYGCTDTSATRCKMVSRMPVTELFRYQDGRWIY